MNPLPEWTVAAESGEWFPVNSDYSQIEPTQENAILMSAAPKLLAALQMMVETFSRCSSPAQGGSDPFTWLYQKEFSQAKEAIQLATTPQ